MKKFTILICITLLIVFSGCSGCSDNEPNFDVVSNNVTIWEDSTGGYSIILALEVSNLINAPLHFKESDFDIVDETGTVIETMNSVSAYPPVVKRSEVAVYYDAKTSDRISDANVKLKAIPHIETEKSKIKGEAVGTTGATTGGSLYADVLVHNASSRNEYNNVHIAVISRKSNNEVVSVMTGTIDSIKPREELEIRVEDRLKQRNLGADIVTKYQLFSYLDP